MFQKAFFTTLFSLASIKGHTDMDTPIPPLLQETIDDCGAVGAAVGVIDHGNVSYFTYGKKDIGGEEPITEESIFEIGSITKVFTTLSLMDLVHRGVVELDDPIELYLPDVKVPEKDGKKITLRHLATHTSGLPSIPTNFIPKNPKNPYEDLTVEILYDFLNQMTLTRAPGEAFEYSNCGMGLLGHILTLQTKKSYEDMIQNLVCGPLGMENTGIALNEEMSRNAVQGHHLRKATPYWELETLAGAGALRSNIRDMTQFLAANMGLIDSPLGELLQKCHERQCTATPEADVGLGWIRSISPTAKIIWHNGGTGGFRSYLGFNPAEQRGVVVLSNSTNDWPDEFGSILLDPGFQPPLVNKELANDPTYLEKFGGTYALEQPNAPEPIDLQLSVSGKLLAAVFGGHGCSMLYSDAFGVFRMKGASDVSLHFNFDEEGNVSKLEGFFKEEKLWDAIRKK